jgi:hypothetical protein
MRSRFTLNRTFLNRTLLLCLITSVGALSHSLVSAEEDFINSAPDSSPAEAISPARPSTNQCASLNDAIYQKSLAITNFPRIEANSSKAGRLYKVESWLPEQLLEQLTQRQPMATTRIPHGLTPPHFQQSGQATEVQFAEQIKRLGRDHRAQFLLSGQILDMSMADPKMTYQPGLYRRAVNGIHDGLGINTRFDKRDRIFSFYLNLRDSFTGQTLFQRNYSTYGSWGLTSRTGIDIGSPRFEQSDYGQQVKNLVAQASEDVARAINCQPYIARADMRPGQQQIVLHGGAHNGLRAGDKLELYQLVMRPINGEYQAYDTRLVKRDAAVELQEVYSTYSVALVHSEYLLSGQFLAVSP